MITICNYEDISGVTPDEYFEYHCQDEKAKLAYENSIEDTSKLEKELEYTNKRLESIEEQLFFATELLDSIEHELNNSTRMNEFKKRFRHLVEESYLER